MTGFAIFGALVSIPALLAISTILNGWVLVYLWLWFISPVFGLAELTLGQAIGLSMVVSFLSYQYIESQKSKDSDLFESLFTAFFISIFRPALVFSFGWLIQAIF